MEVLRSSLFHAEALDYMPEGGLDAWSPALPVNPAGWGSPFSPSPAATSNAVASRPAGTATSLKPGSPRDASPGEGPGHGSSAWSRGGGSGSRRDGSTGRSPSPVRDNWDVPAAGLHPDRLPSPDGGDVGGNASALDYMDYMLKMDSTVLPAGPLSTGSSSSGGGGGGGDHDMGDDQEYDGGSAAQYDWDSVDEASREAEQSGGGGYSRDHEEHEEVEYEQRMVTPEVGPVATSESSKRSSSSPGEKGSQERDSIGQLWQQLMQPTPLSDYSNQETPTEVWSVLASQLPLPTINAPALKGLVPGPAASKKLSKLWDEPAKPPGAKPESSKVSKAEKVPDAIDLEGKPIPTHHRLFTPSQSRSPETQSGTKASGSAVSPPKAKPSSSVERPKDDVDTASKSAAKDDTSSATVKSSKVSTDEPKQAPAAARRVEEVQQEQASRDAPAKRPNNTPFGSVFEAAKRFLDWEDRELKRALPPAGKWVYVTPEEEANRPASPAPTRPKSPTANTKSTDTSSSTTKPAPTPKRPASDDTDKQQPKAAASAAPAQKLSKPADPPKPSKSSSKVESSSSGWAGLTGGKQQSDEARASSSSSSASGGWGVIDEEELPGLKRTTAKRGSDDESDEASPLDVPWYLNNPRRSPSPQRSPSPSRAPEPEASSDRASSSKPQSRASPDQGGDRDRSSSPSPSSTADVKAERLKSRSPSPWLSLTAQLKDDDEVQDKPKPVAKAEIKPAVKAESSKPADKADTKATGKDASKGASSAAQTPDKQPKAEVKAEVKGWAGLQQQAEVEEEEEEASELEAELLSKQVELERAFQELQERQELVALLERELDEQDQGEGQQQANWGGWSTTTTQQQWGSSSNGNGTKPSSSSKSDELARGSNNTGVEMPVVQEGQVLVKLSMRYVAAAQQVVRFVGGRPEFGSWLPEESPVFYWIQGDMWVADVPLWPGYYQFKPMIYNTETGEADWEPGPMRAITVPDRPGGGTLLLNCDWCEFEMEAKFYYDRVVEPDGTVRYSTEILRMDATMDIEGL